MPYAYPLAIPREANTGPLSASFFSESAAIAPGVDSSANTGRFGFTAKRSQGLLAGPDGLARVQRSPLCGWPGQLPRPLEAADHDAALAVQDEEATDTRLVITAAGCWVSQRLPPGDPRRLFL